MWYIHPSKKLDMFFTPFITILMRYYNYEWNSCQYDLVIQDYFEVLLLVVIIIILHKLGIWGNYCFYLSEVLQSYKAKRTAFISSTSVVFESRDQIWHIYDIKKATFSTQKRRLL